MHNKWGTKKWAAHLGSQLHCKSTDNYVDDNTRDEEWDNNCNGRNVDTEMDMMLMMIVVMITVMMKMVVIVEVSMEELNRLHMVIVMVE